MSEEEFMDKVRKEFPTARWMYKSTIGSYEYGICDRGHYAHSLDVSGKNTMSYTVRYSDRKKWTLSYIGVLCITVIVENCSDLSEARLELSSRIVDRVCLIKQNHEDRMARIDDDLKVLGDISVDRVVK